MALLATTCGPEVDEPSAGSTTTGTSSQDADPTTSTTPTDATSKAEESSGKSSTEDSTTTGIASSSTTDIVDPPCNGLAVEDCDEKGCSVFSGPAFRYDALANACIDIGTYELCARGLGAAAPVEVWRVDERGEIVIVALQNTPGDLLTGPWKGCWCNAGDPFACWGCGFSGCESTGLCGDATTEEECASRPSECQWLPAFVVEGDGSGCASTETPGRCVTTYADKGDCDQATTPATCTWTEAAPPHVRAVEGGMEVITGVTCNELPAGYVPCWSAPAGDPPACDCVC